MDDKTQALLKELFEQLPKPIQRAITSVGVQKQLRELASKYKLHLDQGESLENEVIDSLLGLKRIEDLETNIKNSTGVSAETAAELAGDISEIIFSPIREELERELEHPEAKAKEVSGVEATRAQVLREAAPGGTSNVSVPTAQKTNPPPQSPPVQAATPPSPPPTEKAVRGPASGAYKSGEPSATRKDIHDDPYREPPA